MDIKFMQKALETAKLSGEDIPVGAVIVKDGQILSSCHNQKELHKDVTAHAEMLALKEASKKLNSWRLCGCDMYVTLEPCPMCAWAILNSRLENLYFGSYDSLYGAFSTMPQLINKCNSSLNFKGGIMEQECDTLLSDYLRNMRK